MLGPVHPPESAQLLLTTSQRTPRLVRSTSCRHGEAQQVQRSQYGLCWLVGRLHVLQGASAHAHQAHVKRGPVRYRSDLWKRVVGVGWTEGKRQLPRQLSANF